MGPFVACTVCGTHPADEVNGVHPAERPSFPYDKCECCGTLILLCSPWPNHRGDVRVGWWERCRIPGCCPSPLEAAESGHTPVEHTPARCKAAQNGGELPPQHVGSPEVAVPPPYRSWAPRAEWRGMSADSYIVDEAVDYQPPPGRTGVYQQAASTVGDAGNYFKAGRYLTVDEVRAALADTADVARVWGEVRLSDCPLDPPPAGGELP